MTQVAFIGLGTMGLPMARNIIEGGFSVSGFDLSAAACEQHSANGGTVADSAIDAVKTADIVITMLPKGEHVKLVLFGENGIATHLKTDAIYVDMSTIHPDDTDQIRAGIAKHDIAMVDAPVGRTSMHAETGQLLIMAGGESEHIKAIEPVLSCMGDTIVDCGGPGMGGRMKIINNFMSISLNALTAETLVLAEATGLDVQKAIDVMLGTAAGQGHMGGTYPAKVLKGDLSPAFMLDLAHKDIGLALDVANGLNVPLPLGASAREVYSIARSQGFGDKDWTSLYASSRRIAGLES